jgi:hypothetical protein
MSKKQAQASAHVRECVQNILSSLLIAIRECEAAIYSEQKSGQSEFLPQFQKHHAELKQLFMSIYETMEDVNGLELEESAEP